MKPPRFVHSQRMTIALGILSIVLVIVVLQLWLFTSTMEAFWVETMRLRFRPGSPASRASC